MYFDGYIREDGKIGTRNYIAIIPTVFCANSVAKKISEQVNGALVFPHSLGCGYPGPSQDLLKHVIKQISRHPNFGAIILVGLGCERISVKEIANELSDIKKPLKTLIIQEEGSTLRTIQKGCIIASELAIQLSKHKREKVDLEHLIIGVKCGGTDATSGISSNPALGIASDAIVNNGGTVLITEITELLGTESIISRRAINKGVADKVLKVVDLNARRLEAVVSGTSNSIYKKWDGYSLVSPGNADGGVTNIVEKALGGLKKSGDSPFQDVIEYADNPPGRGLYLMDGPGHDAEAVTGLVGSGAQVVVFTTGRGTPTGFPGIPIIKVTGNHKTFEKMKDNIDFNAGTLFSGNVTLDQLGQQLYQEIIEVACGKSTKAEIFGDQELFCISRFMTETRNCSNYDS